MPIGITEDHEALRQVVRRFVETQCPPAVARSTLDAEHEDRPPFWAALAEPGWLGLHVDEAYGGAGYGMVEQCVVVEELGRAGAPGPYVASVLAAAIVEAAGTADVAKALLPGIVDGTTVATVALSGTLDAVADGDGLRVSGALQPVLAVHLADVVVASTGSEWVVVDTSDATVRELR